MWKVRRFGRFVHGFCEKEKDEEKEEKERRKQEKVGEREKSRVRLSDEAVMAESL